MNTFDRPLWRAASRITAALSTAFPKTDTLTFPARAWQALHALQQQHYQAVSRGWSHAVAQLQQRLRTQLDWLRTDLALLEQELQQSLQPGCRVSVPLVYQELLALRAEFGELELDLRETTLRVTTEDIVLDELALGPFELVWNWSRLGTSRELKVVALEPRRPAARSDVTHPHVLEDVLCEGDAALPLQQALRAGRLCDHFVIVRQVLQTYNASSPYVTLADWNGVRCDACGDGVCQDDSTPCDLCGDALCDGCVQYCDRCSRACCAACSTPCGDCDTRHCLRCWPPSAQHRGVSCPSCVTEESEHASSTSPETPDPAASVHPHGLGQAALAAGSG